MASTIEPTTLAQQLATAYNAPAQNRLAAEKSAAGARSVALTRIQSALSTFNASMATLSGKQGVTANSATLSVPGVATAVAKPTAVAATYSFFVEQTAKADQIAFEDLPTVPVASGGPLVISLASGENFTVDLSAADADLDGTLTQTEIGRAINQATGNAGKVTASVVKSGTQTNLILSSAQTGAGSKITVDASGLPAGTAPAGNPLKTAFSAAPKQLVAAQDAILWLGDQGSGVRVQQASNTFTAIDGVSLTVTKPMATGDASAQLTVGNDAAETAANMQTLVDSYNILKKTLDELTAIDKTTGQSSIFASDAGVRNLRSRLGTLVRQDFGGVRLMDFGVGTTKDGMLTLNKAKLADAVAIRGTDLNKLLGSQAMGARSGLLGELDIAVDSWTDVTGGHIRARQDGLQALNLTFTTRQEKLDRSYQQMYTRYATQFSQLQALQERMSGVSDMFAGMMSTSKN